MQGKAFVVRLNAAGREEFREPASLFSLDYRTILSTGCGGKKFNLYGFSTPPGNGRQTD